MLMASLAPLLTNVLDIGANVGWYSCLLAHAGLRSEGRILALEPNPAIRDVLAANADRHTQVEALYEAVTDNAGESCFYTAPSSDLSSATRGVGTKIVVRATTVDDPVAQGLGSVDLVKSDVEGGELAVLRGTRRVRAGANPPIWMIEVNENFLREAESNYEELEKPEFRSWWSHGLAGIARGCWRFRTLCSLCVCAHAPSGSGAGLRGGWEGCSGGL